MQDMTLNDPPAPTNQNPATIPAAQNTKSKYAVFEEWLLSNGATFPHLELRSYDAPDVTSKESKDPSSPDEGLPCEDAPDDSEMRGVHANRPVPAHSQILTVPRRLLITVEMGKATPLGSAILRHGLDLDAPKHVFLMVFLLQDRVKEDSFFRPYYDVLPRTLSNMPIFWTTEELEMLKGR